MPGFIAPRSMQECEVDSGKRSGWAVCTLSLIWAMEKAPNLTQNLKLTPRSHLGSSHPEPAQASTHKSVKSSRVSSGVNTSSSPITWGTSVRQDGEHTADARTQCTPKVALYSW